MAAVSYMLATPSCSQRQAGHGAPSPCCSSVVPLFRTSIAGKRIAHGNLPTSASRRSARQACRAADTAQAEVKTLGGENGMRPEDVAEEIPKPSIKIDNEHDPFATIVCISYGDRLGELLDTVAALKNLNLNVRRAKIGQNEKGTNRHKFYITDSTTSEKILKSRRLEEIRLTILNNLLLFHPESGEELAWGIRARKADNSVDVPLGARSNRAVDTVINISHNEDSAFSVLHIRTLDRPGLLVEVVKVLKDVNVNVISAEVDTEGRIASDIFYVTYHGEPLNQSMVQLVTNALQYYLSLNDVEREESY